MAEELILPESAGKIEIYETLLPQLKALTAGEADLTANLANISAALKQVFNWWWVGFYVVKGDQLVLAPFQGPVACTRIAYGKGVCGRAWKEKKTLFVPDVNRFAGHIACSNFSVSEIVTPVFDKDGEVAGVIDVDSERFDVLDETDVHYLEKIASIVGELF
ncbi:MAG: GAF domain-containing protein [Prevotellaceae bacterium]|nr:GAF domain-containing protein [Prevotellaceae bacterium]